MQQNPSLHMHQPQLKEQQYSSLVYVPTVLPVSNEPVKIEAGWQADFGVEVCDYLAEARNRYQLMTSMPPVLSTSMPPFHIEKPILTGQPSTSGLISFPSQSSLRPALPTILPMTITKRKCVSKLYLCQHPD